MVTTSTSVSRSSAAPIVREDRTGWPCRVATDACPARYGPPRCACRGRWPRPKRLVADGLTDDGGGGGGRPCVIDAEPRARFEYATVFDPGTLESLTELDRPARIAAAVWFAGEIRLIDNRQLVP